MSEFDYGDYEELCGGLEQLAVEFESALDRFGPVYHRLIHSQKVVSASGWKKFAEAYRTKENSDAERWEECRPHPSGMACSYFYGHGSKANLEEFTRLADSGYALLLELQELQEEGSIPSDADIRLSERYRGSNWDLSNRYFDWLVVLHDTAMGCHTMRLRDNVGFWELDQGSTLSNEDSCEEIEQASEEWSDSGVDRYPLHPLTESLQHDLFLSSAEAIRIWLDPWDDEIIPVGKGIEDSPIFLPLANSVVDDDAESQAEPPIQLPKANSGDDAVSNLSVPLAHKPTPEIPLKPRWDAKRRQFSVGQILIKWFRKQRAPNQVKVLEAFEAQGWPSVPIENPLIDSQAARLNDEVSIAGIKQLNDTVRGLNDPEHHKTKGVIKFYSEVGRVWWELLTV